MSDAILFLSRMSIKTPQQNNVRIIDSVNPYIKYPPNPITEIIMKRPT